jgi:hypothetical protein
MPQSTYLPLYAASYPILAKVQKPGGVTVLATVSGGDVPNKPTYVAGTIQSVESLAELAAEQEEAAREAAQEASARLPQASPEEAVEEDEEEDVEEDDGNGGTVKRKRTVPRTRTTTHHRRR